MACISTGTSSAVLNVVFDHQSTNALLDTGASCSLIDLGSLQSLGLDMHLANSDNELIDASGNKMNIIGSIDINIELNGIHLVQNMKVLNSKTFRNIILGRDFLSHFETVEFDFPKNRIKLGHQWFNCVKIKGK